jgi:hypothetical protein
MNTHGFRGPELVAGRATIVCFGASETFGISESRGKEFPRQLERQIAHTRGGPYQVVNAAYPGARIADIRQVMRRAIPLTHPRFAILYLSPASVVWTDKEWDAIHPTAVSKDPPLEQTARSRMLARLTDKVADALPAPLRSWRLRRDLASSITAARTVPSSHLPEANFMAFRRSYERMLAILEAAHVRVIVATHATRFGPVGALRDEQMDTLRTFYPKLTEAGVVDTERRFNDVLRRVARAHRGVIIVDAANLIAPGPQNFADFFHFTDRGSARIAALLAAAVTRNAGIREPQMRRSTST